MDISRKFYKRAVDKYNSGYIDEAIDLCERSISFNLKNTAAINLKGLLYYFKGDEKSARSLWKMNRDYNKDETADIYLASLDKDARNIEEYMMAYNQLKELKVAEALEKLLDCARSDFNCINVYNAIAACYIFQAKYEEAAEYIGKVIKVDKKNEEAKKSIKELKGYYTVERTPINSKVAVGIVAALIVMIASVFIIKTLSPSGYKISNPLTFFKSKKTILKPIVKKTPVVKKTGESKDIKSDEKKQNKPEEASKPEQSKANTSTSSKTAVFSSNNMKRYLKKQDSGKIYSMIKDIDIKKLSDDDKVIYSRAVTYMKSKGVVDFYSDAAKLQKNKKYKQAIFYYNIAKKYGRSHYLYPSILFMLGSSYEKTDQFSNAIDCFKEYLAGKYKEGYEAQVLYQLAAIYKDIDINKAKVYATELRKNYADTMYNNSVIDRILKK